MVQVSIRQPEALEKLTPTLFLAAGGLLVVYGVLNGMEAFFDTGYSAVQNVFGPAGFVFGFVGLLTSYSLLNDQHPVLTRVGGVSVILGTVGFSAIVLGNILGLVGIISAEPAAWTAVFVILAAIGMLPGFLSFAVATLQTDAYPRSVGVLLFAPPVIFATMLTGSYIGFTPAWSAFAISGGQAVAHLAIGHALWNSPAPTSREISSTGVTAS